MAVEALENNTERGMIETGEFHGGDILPCPLHVLDFGPQAISKNLCILKISSDRHNQNCINF